MPVEIKKHPDHPEDMAARVAKRLKPSNLPSADVHVQHGTGPTRTHTSIHHSATEHQHGPVKAGEN